MWKSGIVAALAAAAFAPFAHAASTDGFADGMNTMWEALWHQSGTATRLVRWDQDLKVRISGVHAEQHRQHALQALRDAAAEGHLKVIDVSDSPDAAQQANVSIEITPDTALNDLQPCETRLNFATETRIDSVSMKMRDGEEWRCAYHESMHVMGVRGHPAGETVLSYFTHQVEGLEPLDRAMLRAWYSPRAHGGMTPFEFLPILADQLVAIMPDRARAQGERDQFLAATFTQMQAFAEGAGDVPRIIKDCGKATDAAIRFGRMEMSYFVGVAYMEGTTVAKDPAAGLRWLQRAAALGSGSAKAKLAADALPARG